MPKNLDGLWLVDTVPPKAKKVLLRNKPGIFAGWISRKWGIVWVVSPHRADKKTGKTTPAQWGPYAEELLAAAVPWRKECDE